MTFDLARHLGAVTHTVERCERDGRPAHMVVAICGYDTEVEDLWDALSNRARIHRWVLPVSGDLRLGGRYQLEGNAGGTITRCEPPTHLSLTWEHAGDISWVSVTLMPEPHGGSRLRLEHVAHVDDARWDEYGPGAVGVGWDLTLLGLARHLATGEGIDSKEGLAWLSTPDGKDFVRRSSDAWCRASTASGTDSTAASAAAERTRAAYTGDAGSPES